MPSPARPGPAASSSARRPLASLATPASLVALALLAAAVGAHGAPGRAGSWQDDARRFTGESDQVRDRAIAALLHRPGIENEIRAALTGPDKFLALDVVAALPLPGLYPDLVRLSGKDGTGYFYHALNALVTPANRAEIAALYRARVARDDAAMPAKLALIDTLARLQAPLSEGELAVLLADPSYEVRESAIAYVRTTLRAGAGAGYVSLLAQPLREGPFQLRMQVLLLASEVSRDFSRRLSNAWRSVLEPCATPDRFVTPLTDDERALCAKAAKAEAAGP